MNFKEYLIEQSSQRMLNFFAFKLWDINNYFLECFHRHIHDRMAFKTTSAGCCLSKEFIQVWINSFKPGSNLIPNANCVRTHFVWHNDVVVQTKTRTFAAENWIQDKNWKSAQKQSMEIQSSKHEMHIATSVRLLLKPASIVMTVLLQTKTAPKKQFMSTVS